MKTYSTKHVIITILIPGYWKLLRKKSFAMKFNYCIHLTDEGNHEKFIYCQIGYKIARQNISGWKRLSTWKTACFSWGVALSSFCWINLEPCWSWLNSTTWSVSSRSCRFGYRLFLKLDAYYRAARIIYLNVFKEIMRRGGGWDYSLYPFPPSFGW